MEAQKDPAAVSLGQRGGKAGKGKAKAHGDRIRAWWASTEGLAHRERLKLSKRPT